MPDNEMWIPIVMFVSIAVVLSFWLYFRYRARLALQQTVQKAIERGQDLSPELLDRLGQRSPSRQADLRRGIIAVGLAVGFAAFGFALGEPDAVRPFLAISAFPFLIGAAYLILWRFGKRSAD